MNNLQYYTRPPLLFHPASWLSPSVCLGYPLPPAPPADTTIQSVTDHTLSKQPGIIFIFLVFHHIHKTNKDKIRPIFPATNNYFYSDTDTIIIQANLDMTDSMEPGKLVRHLQNLSYTYDTYLICMGLGPSISSVIDKGPSYSGLSYPSSSVY